MVDQYEFNDDEQDVKMGTAESSQSSELGVIAGLANPSSFHQQSPNVARLIRSDTSSKMEYEFPMADLPPGSSSYHHPYGGGGGGRSNANHSINTNRLDQTYSHPSSSLTSPQQTGPSSQLLGNTDPLARSKIHSSQTSNLWLTLTSCFGCRARHPHDSSTNSLRDKVHAIRIVRASNDLTPAVFDSHYNIITLEQLRECDNNGGGTIGSLPNDLPDAPLAQHSNVAASNQNGNGSAVSSSSTKGEHGFRMKKKKKRSAMATSASKGMGSDDDDERS